jgi:hypothetical protein
MVIALFCDAVLIPFMWLGSAVWISSLSHLRHLAGSTRMYRTVYCDALRLCYWCDQLQCASSWREIVWLYGRREICSGSVGNSQGGYSKNSSFCCFLGFVLERERERRWGYASTNIIDSRTSFVIASVCSRIHWNICTGVTLYMLIHYLRFTAARKILEN